MTGNPGALLACIPNVSEGRDTGTVDALATAAARASWVLDVSTDPDHNRTVLSLAGQNVEEAAFALVAEAVRRIDLRRHSGVHPRRGVADVLPLVPLGKATLPAAVAAAHRLGVRIWQELRTPVYFYGAAGSHTLAGVRSASPPPPDLGDSPHPTAGVVCVGARGPLIAYNALLIGVDLPAARRLAVAIRESSGGVPGVQALAFAVSAGIQLSMNLTRPEECPPRLALGALQQIAGREHVGRDEIVGLCSARAALGCDAATGKILEACLAAAAARGGAALCRARPRSEEMERLAIRLEAEAASLANLGPAAVLDGAERSAALLRVLAAAKIHDAELEAMLGIAARGFRQAVDESTAAAFPKRVAALDRWLTEA